MSDTDELGSLNDQQQEVVDHVLAKPVTVVAAGAGSGKTYTMIEAAVKLAEEHPDKAPLGRFALITFTVKAADELRDKLAARLRKADLKDGGAWSRREEALANAFVGTIHSFCSRILSTYGYSELVARSASRTLATTLENEAVVDTLEEALSGGPQSLPALVDLRLQEHELATLVRRIAGYCRTVDLGLDDLSEATAKQPPDQALEHRKAIAELVRRSEARYRYLKDNRALLDADDLLLRLSHLLSSSDGKSSLAERIAQRYRVVFIDEFQDTDRTQKAIVDALVPHLYRLLVVGDRKQSIYGFRAADCGLLDALAKHHKALPVLDLSISRRPTRQLLKVQNALFRVLAEDGRYPELGQALKPWDGTRDAPDFPALHYREVDTYPAQVAEAARFIEKVLDEYEIPEQEGKWRRAEAGDIVVLCRSNRVVDEFVECLPAELPPNVRVRRDSGGGFFTAEEIVATYRTLRLVLDYRHDLALSLALGTPYFTEVAAAAQERGILTYRPTEGAPLTDWFEAEHPDLAAALADLRRASRTDTAPQLLGRFYRTFPIRERLAAENDFEGVARLERLREEARRLFRSEEALTLRTFVDWLRLAILRDSQGDETIGESVAVDWIRVMTIHRAKGLEFPVVIIPSLQRPVNDGDDRADFYADAKHGLDLVEPKAGLDLRSPRFAEIQAKEAQAQREEEFRLLYVGVTRAQCAVHLLAKWGGRPGDFTTNTQDRFYGWRDEVLRARDAVSGAGGRYSV